MTKAVIEAPAAFFLVAETARLIDIALRSRQEVSAVVKQIMIGEKTPSIIKDARRPTGGYEIHIIIHPPPAQDQAAPPPHHKLNCIRTN